MKHQYVGDISDYRKYALLRALSWGGANRIGVCWMLTPSDGSSDGGKLAYLQQPERYRQFDPPLFDILAHASEEPHRRRLQSIEDSGAIPGAAYFNELLPDEKAGRDTFMDCCESDFKRADIVFFDPDNGLEASLAKGRKNSSKYLYLDEVARFTVPENRCSSTSTFPEWSGGPLLRPASSVCEVWRLRPRSGHSPQPTSPSF
ncbi:hypothetical protein ACVOMV_06035 [Mesorhizobium atlanticum]